MDGHAHGLLIGVRQLSYMAARRRKTKTMAARSVGPAGGAVVSW